MVFPLVFPSASTCQVSWVYKVAGPKTVINEKVLYRTCCFRTPISKSSFPFPSGFIDEPLFDAR